MGVATCIAIAALAVLPALYMHEAGRAKRERGDFFAASTGLFDRYRITQEGKNYPLLEGRYRGETVRLEPVLDTMAARKLPSLWLKVTVLRSRANRPTASFLMRPDGNEFYSPSSAMAHRRAIPAAWPQNAIFCTDQMDASPEEYEDYLQDLGPQMVFFADPRAKELVTSPKGVRLVHQAAQAERAYYLVLRQARFELRQADPAVVRTLLDRAIGIADALDDNGCNDFSLRTVAA